MAFPKHQELFALVFGSFILPSTAPDLLPPLPCACSCSLGRDEQPPDVSVALTRGFWLDEEPAAGTGMVKPHRQCGAQRLRCFWDEMHPKIPSDLFQRLHPRKPNLCAEGL